MNTWGEDAIQQLGMLHCVAFSPDGKKLVTGGLLGAAIWKTNANNACLRRLADNSTVDAALFSRDGKLVLVSSQQNESGLWDIETGAQVLEIASKNWKPARAHVPADPYECPAIAFSPDGSRFAVGYLADDCTTIWERTPRR